jgi:3-oxoacyl-[acyl-carrier protein] reductase
MGNKLTGKVAIVTGASKGIGAGIAQHLAAEGASVVVNYSSSKENADSVVARIVNKGGKAIAVKGNLTHKEDLQHLFSETKKIFGKLDILVNNAGVYEFSALEEITPEHFHRMFDLNVLALLLASQEAVKHFGSKGGSIINISSIASTRANPNTSVYSATKASVDTITKILSKELGERKIRVNAINPGLVETEGTHTAGVADSDNDFRKNYESQSALGRIGKTDDIAPAVVFLSSDDASWITGSTLVISGGA